MDLGKAHERVCIKLFNSRTKKSYLAWQIPLLTKLLDLVFFGSTIFSFDGLKVNGQRS